MRIRYALIWTKDTIEAWIRATSRRVMYQWFSSKKLLKLRAIGKNEYRDTDTLIFESVFQNLVNFVEHEKANCAKGMLAYSYRRYLAGKEKWEDIPKCSRHPVIIGYCESSKWDRLVNRKKWNMVLGQYDLEVEADMVNEEPTWIVTEQKESKDGEWYTMEKDALVRQGERAAEILSLYRWYKFERPNRPDPWDDTFPAPARGYIDEDGNVTDQMMDDKPDKDSGEGDEEKFYTMRKMTPEYAEYLRKCSDLEDEYTKEDTRKAVRVVELRGSLWT